MNIRKLTAEEIECRVATVTSNGCTLLLYKTARVDRMILDELFGDLWQNDFRTIDGKMYGGIGIYNKELNQWIWRWDCGTESNTEAEKGQASDCFKRAGFKWGIGIELYSAPFIFIHMGTEKNEKGKWVLKDKFAKFAVKSIGYTENGNIKDLTIVNDKNEQVFKQGQATRTPQKASQEKPQVKQPEPPKNIDLEVFKALAACSKVEDVELIWTKYNKQVQNKEEFINLCKTRKGVILAQGEAA